MKHAASTRTRPLLALSFFIGLILAMLPGTAHAATHQLDVPWLGHGTDSIDVCALDEDPYLHWVLTPGGNFSISEATLHIGSDTYNPDAPLQAQVAHFNTPYIDGALEGTLAASASATYTGPRGTPKPLLVISDGCFAGLVAEKTADATWTRDWTWDLEKSGNSTEETFAHDDLTPRTVTYTVEVSATSEDTYNVSGEVTVTNHPMADPADIVSIEDDTFDLECDPEPPLTLAPGDSVTCTFDEDLEDKTDGTNTVTVTLEDDSTVTASADWAFGAAPDVESDECITVVDDMGTPGDDTDDRSLGTVCASNLVNGEYTFPTYTTTIDPADYLPCCNEVDLTNTATFTTNDTETTGSDDHTVVVHVLCPPGDEGCTPGFWGGEGVANDPAWAYLASEKGITSGSPLFGTGLTIQQGLDSQSTNSNLYFHGAAAYLNALMAENGLIDYSWSVSQVEAIVMGTGVYAGLTPEQRKDLLAAANEKDCPFSATFP